jgi:hypothetical protein
MLGSRAVNKLVLTEQSQMVGNLIIRIAVNGDADITAGDQPRMARIRRQPFQLQKQLTDEVHLAFH